MPGVGELVVLAVVLLLIGGGAGVRLLRGRIQERAEEALRAKVSGAVPPSVRRAMAEAQRLLDEDDPDDDSGAPRRA